MSLLLGTGGYFEVTKSRKMRRVGLRGEAKMQAEIWLETCWEKPTLKPQA
jgi:hypothetical protein